MVALVTEQAGPDVFASDIDGTLYFMGESDWTKRFHPQDIRAIKGFHEHGGLFGVSTGRSLEGVDSAVRGIIDIDFYILASGALILDAQHQPIAMQELAHDVIKDINLQFRDRTDMIIQANSTVYTLGNPISIHQIHVEDVDEIPGHLFGLSFGTDSCQTARNLANEVNRDYGDTVKAYLNVRNVDIVAKECSKGTALETVRRELGASRVGAIGDSYNDIPMLEQADIAFTFKRSPLDVKTRVVHMSHGELVDGVDEAIKKFCEI